MDCGDDRVRVARKAAGLIPAAFIGLFFVWPVAAIVGRGLSGGAFAVMTSGRTAQVVWFTVWQAVASTALTLTIGLPGAWALSRPFRGVSVVRGILTVAFVLPTVVVAAAFTAVERAGLAPWPAHGIGAILAAHVFFNYAVVVRVVGAAWARLSTDDHEAARTLGAGPWTALRRVDWPALRPAVAAASAIVFLFTFTSFGVVLILGGLGRATIEVEIWRRTVQLLDLDGAAGLVLIQMAAVLAGLFAWSRAATGSARTANADRPRPPLPRLARLVALAPGLLLIGVPISVMVTRSLRTEGGYGLTWYRALGTARQGSTAFVDPLAATGNSLAFAVGATAVSLLIGSLSAVHLRKRRTAAAAGLDAALMLPLGTSAVTLGFGLLITFDSPPLDLRGSALIIPLAHALVGIPFVVRSLVPALRSMPVALGEAARTLGASPARVARRVTLPWVAPALAVGAGFAAAVSLGEFGATTFLSRPGSATVPIAVYRLLGKPGAANQGQALALSVLLMVMVTAVVAAAELVDSAWARRRGR